MKTTPWFKSPVRPARAGVYQRDYGGLAGKAIAYSFYDARGWRFFDDTARKAARQNGLSNMKDLPWRGLKEPA